MKMKKLNVGCSDHYKKGWVNLDIGNTNQDGLKIYPEVIHDLNIFPYPFKDNEFDYVLISHTLEHLDNPFKVVDELKRITKHNGIIKIVVPHFSCNIAYNPQHKHFFAIDNIQHFNGDCQIVTKKFRASYNKIINLPTHLINLKPRIFERFFYAFYPIQEIIWILKKNTKRLK